MVTLAAKVAVKALQEKEPLSVLAKKYHVAPSVITSWKEIGESDTTTINGLIKDSREQYPLTSINWQFKPYIN